MLQKLFGSGLEFILGGLLLALAGWIGSWIQRWRTLRDIRNMESTDTVTISITTTYRDSVREHNLDIIPLGQVSLAELIPDPHIRKRLIQYANGMSDGESIIRFAENAINNMIGRAVVGHVEGFANKGALQMIASEIKYNRVEYFARLVFEKDTAEDVFDRFRIILIRTALCHEINNNQSWKDEVWVPKTKWNRRIITSVQMAKEWLQLMTAQIPEGEFIVAVCSPDYEEDDLDTA